MKIKQQQGVAVITVILIVALLTTLMAYAAESQLMLVRRVTNQNMLEQSYQLALGGEQWISTILQEDAENSETRDADHFGEDWNAIEESVTLDVGEITVEVLDQSGLLNLNALANYPSDPDSVHPEFEGTVWILNNLMLLLDIDTRLVGNLVDWIDNNNADQPARKQTAAGVVALYAGGAEDGHYTGLEKPYRAANQKLSSIGELKYIKGFDQEIIKKLAPFVTALPDERLQINLNTAPEMLLKAMSNAPAGEPENLAEIVEKQQNPDETVDKADAQGDSWLPVVQSIVDVKSQFFTVTTEANFGDLRYSMRSVLYRSFEPDQDQANKVEPVRVVKRERILL